jgi:hypothetical protein
MSPYLYIHTYRHIHVRRNVCVYVYSVNYIPWLLWDYSRDRKAYFYQLKGQHKKGANRYEWEGSRSRCGWYICNICMYVCTYACIYVCNVCVCMYRCMYVYMYIIFCVLSDGVHRCTLPCVRSSSAAVRPPSPPVWYWWVIIIRRTRTPPTWRLRLNWCCAVGMTRCSCCFR